MDDVRPLHRRLADELRGDIDAGRYPRGSQLPSEHQLAGRHSVARGTVRQALATLRSEGVIAVRRGARPVVLGPARTQSFAELQSFTSWARTLHEQPSGRVIELGSREATTDEARALGLADGDEVLGLLRLRLLGDRAAMVERTAFASRVAGLVTAADLETGSIYEHLARHGIEVAHARHAIDAIAAGTLDARLLEVPRRTPLLRDRRLGLDGDGAPLEWSDDRYRSDLVVFGVDNATTASSLTRLRATDQGADHVDRRAS